MIRNAGGVVTHDEIRSLATSQRLLGTGEIILVHHADCGMLTSTEEEFRGAVAQDLGRHPAWHVEAFGDLEQERTRSSGSSTACSSR